VDKIKSSEAPGDVPGDMALDVPPPPADAAQDMPTMDDPNAMGGEEPTDPVAGGPDDDPMAGDPNALSAGQGNDDISQKYQQLSPDQQKAADKYVDSMLNNDDQSGAAAPQQMESKFNFKHIIDEVFGEVEKQTNFTKGVSTREEQNIGEDAMTEYQSPFTPRA
jgi:hypothetical protein